MTDKPKIIINGREIAGPEDVPDFLRRFVEDADKNGIPDFMEQFLKNPIFKMILGKSGMDIKKALANLPQDKRAHVEQLLAKLSGSPTASSSASGGPTVMLGSADVLSASSPAVPPTAHAHPTLRHSEEVKIDYKALGISDPTGEASPSRLKGLVWLAALAVLAAAAYFGLRLL